MGFGDLELHPSIAKALAESSFRAPTAVQKKIFPLAMRKRNIVCSAKTGSGKTLAFLLPTLQRLLDMRWSRDDGLGAVVIAPTRELALQIFGVLQKVGKHTSLSGGLLIGGRDSAKEKQGLNAMNIIVCTPGRLLEQLESVWDFSGDNLEMLVIDEADKMVEMGFKETVDGILEFLGKKRQTLLFSATAESVARERRLWGIEAPEFVAVRSEDAPEATPSTLVQECYWVTLANKFDFLYYVIKRNLRKKVIVFLSTCKEVNFFYEAFKKLRLGLPLQRLSGAMSQGRRVDIYTQFCKESTRLLFCTDIAARGLDFPSVDLIVQLDCPESRDTYIHRVGRTARNGAKGRAILALLDGEKQILEEIQEAVKFSKIKKFAPKVSVQERIRGLVRADASVYLLAQKYVKTYRGFLRVHKKKYFGRAMEEISELAEYLGVAEDENVRWSEAEAGPKSPGNRIVFEDLA